MNADDILIVMGTVAFERLYSKVTNFYNGDSGLSEEQIKEEIKKVFKLKEKKD